jgi:hypothetical protein
VDLNHLLKKSMSVKISSFQGLLLIKKSSFQGLLKGNLIYGLVELKANIIDSFDLLLHVYPFFVNKSNFWFSKVNHKYLCIIPLSLSLSLVGRCLQGEGVGWSTLCFIYLIIFFYQMNMFG